MHRRQVILAGAAGLLLLVAVLLVMALLTGRWRNPSALGVRRLVVDKGTDGATLRFEGSGFDRQTKALLVPAVDFENIDGQVLLPHTPLYKIDSDGKLGVASTRGRRLVTLDVRDGQRPRILGSLKLKEALDDRAVTITALVQVGTQALVGLSPKEGLLLVDLKDPASPRNLAYFHLPDVVKDMLAVNGRVYVAANKGGLWQVNINGSRLESKEIPGLEAPWRLAAAGNRLVVVNLRGEVALYEIDNAKGASLVGREHLTLPIRGVTLGNDALHLCLADGSLLEYSVADWPKLALRGRVRLTGRPLILVRSENPRMLFCNLIGAGLCVIDVSRAGAPQIVGWLPTSAPIADLEVVSGRLLVSDSEGLQIYNLAKLRYQQLAIEFPFSHNTKRSFLLNWQGEGFIHDQSKAVSLAAPTANRHRPAVQEAGQGMLAVPGDNVVNLYERPISPGIDPVLHATLPIRGKGTAAFMRDGRLYVLSSMALHVFADDRVGGYRLLGVLDGFDDAQSLAWVGEGVLLVGDKPRGVVAVNIKDASAPRVIAEQRLPAFIVRGSGGVQDLLVSGQRAFVARGEFGVQVLDLSRLPELKIVQQIDTPGIARQLASSDDLLLVADRSRGIQIVDLREDRFRIIGTMPFPANISNFIATKDELLMSNGAGGVIRLPLPRRLQRVNFDDDERGEVVLPGDLPGGRYRLVLYDRTGGVGADFTLN